MIMIIMVIILRGKLVKRLVCAVYFKCTMSDDGKTAVSSINRNNCRLRDILDELLAAVCHTDICVLALLTPPNFQHQFIVQAAMWFMFISYILVLKSYKVRQT